jgi:hypothetical protein
MGHFFEKAPNEVVLFLQPRNYLCLFVGRDTDLCSVLLPTVRKMTVTALTARIELYKLSMKTRKTIDIHYGTYSATL